jgi:hypothetical protein
MTKEMKKAIARLKRENRVVMEPEDYDGADCYTLWTLRYGKTYITDIWTDGEIVYAEEIE